MFGICWCSSALYYTQHTLTNTMLRLSIYMTVVITEMLYNSGTPTSHRFLDRIFVFIIIIGVQTQCLKLIRTACAYSLITELEDRLLTRQTLELFECVCNRIGIYVRT